MKKQRNEMNQVTMTRRELLAAALALSAVGIPKALGATASKKPIPYRKLGRTGESVSIIGLGGAHIGKQNDENESIRIIRTAIDNGINFMDNSWDYNNGQSEIRMGKALRDGYRQKVFLMTKIDGRNKPAAEKQIEESLRRLQTDTLDLLQFHEIIRMSDSERIFAPGGAMDAVLAARQAGKVRYIGFTGHKSPDIHLRMLQTAFDHHFTFDAVQMPLNVMDAHYHSFEKKVLPILLEHRIAVLGMKPMGDQIILDSKTVTAVDCLSYAMSLPTSVVITGCDSLKILNQALTTARGFRPLIEPEMTDLIRKTAEAARKGEFERYKTSEIFDSTSQNPEWLG